MTLSLLMILPAGSFRPDTSVPAAYQETFIARYLLGRHWYIEGMATPFKWPQSLPFCHMLILAWSTFICHHSGELSQCWSRDMWLQLACSQLNSESGFIGSTWICLQTFWGWALPWVPVLFAWPTCNCPGSLSIIVIGLFLSNPRAVILNKILLSCLGP